MNENKPYVSAFCIVGDSGVSTLARAIKSIMFRKSGPLFDEMVIGWNGKDEDALRTALREGFGRPEDFVSLCFGERHVVATSAGSVDLRIVSFEWPGRFDTARNLVMQHCTGEWIYWFDSDDVLADAGTPEGIAAIEAVERANNAPPPQGSRGNTTLKEWLKTLPFEVNCILAPYDYAILEDGSVTIRQMCRRVLRRSSNWVWRSFSGAHEIPYPAASIGEKSIPTFGLLNRHYPKVDAGERIKRNAEIINKMQQPDIVKYADARHHYDVASVHIASANFAGAEVAITEAIKQVHNDEDLYRYLLIRSSVVGTAGRLADGLADAMKATSVYPDRGEAYFAVSEFFYLLGNPKACIKFYEVGAACPPSIINLDLCINRIVRPRANASWAYCDLGDPERGHQLASEAIREYPNDELAKRAYNRCADELMRKRAIEGLVAAGEYYLSKNELWALNLLLDSVSDAVTMRGIDRSVKFFALRNLMDRRMKALPSTSSQAYGSDVIQRNFPPGAPPIDALSFQGESIQLLDIIDQPDGGRAARYKATKKPRITFACYGNGLPWNPTHPETVGIGGSETNFIILARELSKRGYPVTMYVNDGGYYGNIHKGVTWLSLAAFDDTKEHGILVSCRTPWLVRSPTLKGPVYCWHQDNGYANEFSWSPQVEAKLKGSLYVSKWAMEGLLKELSPASPNIAKTFLQRQHVIGNGVLEDWCWARRPRDARPERNPKRVIYASDPMRGLSTLMNVWPIVKAAVPEAELHIYSDFLLTKMLMGLGSANETPMARSIVEDLEKQIRTESGVTYVGRKGQPELTDAMFRAGIYAYPGGSMPEGFGVALVQAAAAGMHVLAPLEGALPEVLDGATLFEPLKTDDDASKFAQVLIGLLRTTGEDYERRERISAGVYERHCITKVADRFEAVLRKDGLIP